MRWQAHTKASRNDAMSACAPIEPPLPVVVTSGSRSRSWWSRSTAAGTLDQALPNTVVKPSISFYVVGRKYRAEKKRRKAHLHLHLHVCGQGRTGRRRHQGGRKTDAIKSIRRGEWRCEHVTGC